MAGVCKHRCRLWRPVFRRIFVIDRKFSPKVCASEYSNLPCNNSGDTNRFSQDGKARKNQKIALNLAAGLLISWGVLKYFEGRQSGLQNFLEVIKARFTVNAVSIPLVGGGGKGDDNSKASLRSSFNFLADVVEKTAPSVVYIEIRASHPLTRGLISISNGSGFVIKSDGLILTNAHVVANHQNVRVKLHDGREFKGVVEDIDSESDLATVRIKATDLPCLQLGKSSDVRPGEFVIAMGNPLTLSNTITAGVISSAHRPSKDLGLHQKTDYIQTDAAINVGNSGGPLVNLDGEVIGINTMKVTEGISFAIPSDRAADFLQRAEQMPKGWSFFGKEKKRAGGVKKRYLGITMLTLTPELIQELQQRSSDFPAVQHGVLVWRVMHGSPAYEGGIRPGDVIIAINGKKVNSSQDIYNFLASDDNLNVTVARGTGRFETVLEPQELPS